MTLSQIRTEMIFKKQYIYIKEAKLNALISAKTESQGHKNYV